MSAVHFVAEGRPVSTNATYRRGKGRGFYKTPEATAWWARVQLAAKIAMRRREPLTGSLAVTLRFYFPSGRNDVDGGIKSVLDACQGIVFPSDNAVRRLLVEKGMDVMRPRVEAEIVEITP
jgi:Holliday junction resolvase RusA-like endonuclease